MTTVAQKTATPAQFIDDLSGALTALTNWSDADTDVTNGGADDTWQNNGRALEHAPTGQTLLIYLSTAGASFQDHNHYNPVEGIRFLWCDSWDSANTLPGGNSNLKNKDAMSGSVDSSSYAGNSYVNESQNNRGGGTNGGLWVLNTNEGNTTFRNYELTYYLSAREDGITAAAWNTSDGNNGCASLLNWEHVDNKFWADGYQPFAYWDSYSANNSTQYTEAYAYQYIRSNDNGTDGQVGRQEFGRSEWGTINPDSSDDTFFFRRAVLYESNAGTVPVAFMEDALPNDLSQGASHGDTVTHNATDYQAMAQSGAGSNKTVSALLRYE